MRWDAEGVALGFGDQILFGGAEPGFGSGRGRGGRGDSLLDQVATGGIRLNETEAAVHLENGKVVALIGDDSEDFSCDVACRLRGGWVEVVEDEGDEMIGLGFARDQMQVG
jgi:hypothetical protein